jgi:hypothetical protein
MYNKWYTREGEQYWQRELGSDNDDDDDSDGDEVGNHAAVRRARPAALTEGERFRHEVMNALFDSDTSGAVRCTV